MASTKDLYDELKGNPLVNVKDDYETFNAKLKDPNFLKRLDEVMTKFGKDINAYDIPKKKKGWRGRIISAYRAAIRDYRGNPSGWC